MTLQSVLHKVRSQSRRAPVRCELATGLRFSNRHISSGRLVYSGIDLTVAQGAASSDCRLIQYK
jgi:hypothetical protein